MLNFDFSLFIKAVVLLGLVSHSIFFVQKNREDRGKKSLSDNVLAIALVCFWISVIILSITAVVNIGPVLFTKPRPRDIARGLDCIFIAAYLLFTVYFLLPRISTTQKKGKY